jgi:hypothetical protein
MPWTRDVCTGFTNRYYGVRGHEFASIDEPFAYTLLIRCGAEVAQKADGIPRRRKAAVVCHKSRPALDFLQSLIATTSGYFPSEPDGLRRASARCRIAAQGA